MNKETLGLILLALLLVAGMLLTLLVGSHRSRHGYGQAPVVTPKALPIALYGSPVRTGYPFLLQA